MRFQGAQGVSLQTAPNTLLPDSARMPVSLSQSFCMILRNLACRRHLQYGLRPEKGSPVRQIGAAPADNSCGNADVLPQNRTRRGCWNDCWMIGSLATQASDGSKSPLWKAIIAVNFGPASSGLCRSIIKTRHRTVQDFQALFGVGLFCLGGSGIFDGFAIPLRSFDGVSLQHRFRTSAPD